MFKTNVEEKLLNSLASIIKYYKSQTNKGYQIKYTSGKQYGKFAKRFNDDWEGTIINVLKNAKIYPPDSKYDELFIKYNSDEMKNKILFDINEEIRKKNEEEEAIKKAEEEAKRKAELEAKRLEDEKIKFQEENKKFQEENYLKSQQEENNEIDEQKDEIMEERTQAEGCNIFDLQKKTLTQILKEINDKYNNLPNEKLDGVIYINLKNRFPKKDDFNKFFIQQLKKFDKKYNYEKYKQYMSDKKYSKKYIDELNMGGFLGPLLGGIINVGKKIFGLNDDTIKGSGIFSNLLNMIGLNDKVLQEKNIKAGGIFSNVLSFLGLNDDILEKDELLIKIKPFIDLFKKEKDNKKIDSYLYAIVKLELDDEPEDKIKETFNNLLFKYDELYRPKLHKQRLNKDFYNNTGSFAPALALIPAGITALSSLISSISNAVRGNNQTQLKSKSKSKKITSNNVCGGKIMSLSELQELKSKIN